MVQKHHISSLQKTLNLWAIILILWSIYRSYFKTELPLWIDEFIAKPLVFILPIYIYITRIERKNFFSELDFKSKNLITDLFFGVGIGLIFFLSGAIGFILKTKNFDSLAQVFPSYSIIGYFVLIALATSISEELVSRGFILKKLYDESKNMLTSVFLASFLFFFLHVPILLTSSKIVGFVLIKVMLTDFLLSAAVSYIYLKRRSLIIPILIHAFYNLSFYFFI